MARKKRNPTSTSTSPLTQEELNAALCVAVFNKKWEKAELLVREGADVHLDDELFLREAIKDEQPSEYIDKILSQNADVRILNDAPLTRATLNQDIDTLNILFKYGVKIDDNNSVRFEGDLVQKGKLPKFSNLLLKVIQAGEDVIDCYLINDCDLRVYDDKALFYAAALNNERVFQRLIQHGAQTDNLEKWIERFSNIKFPNAFRESDEQCQRETLNYAQTAKLFLTKYLKKEMELTELFNRYAKRDLSKINITNNIINYDGSLIHLSAKSGKFKLLVDKAIKEKATEQFSFKNLSLKDKDNKSALDYLMETGTIETILRPEIWDFQKNELHKIINAFPKTTLYKTISENYFQRSNQYELAKRVKPLQLKRRPK